MDANVLAKVGDFEITRERMMAVLKSIPQQQAMEAASPEGRKRLLDEMIAGELFYNEAIENGIDKDEAFLVMLEDATRGLLQRYAVEKLIMPLTIDEDAAKEYYENNKSQFLAEETVMARHILVSDEEQAKSIREEIVGGLDFSDAANKYSVCPSKDNGGELGAFTKGKMVPEFEEAAFALPIGELSDLVKTQFGYHLIIVDQRTEATEKPYEEVANQIKAQLLKMKRLEVYDKKVEELKKVYKVEVNEESLK